MAAGGGFGAAVCENITGPCCYIDAEGGVCAAPSVRGSAYCARHRALCQVAPGTREADAIEAEFAREAGRVPALGADRELVLEPLEDLEPDDGLDALDLPLGDAEEGP
jgi:hypothetical protein